MRSSHRNNARIEHVLLPRIPRDSLTVYGNQFWMKPHREDRYGTTICVVARVIDVLVVGRDTSGGIPGVAVVGLDDLLRPGCGSCPSPTRRPRPPALRNAMFVPEMSLTAPPTPTVSFGRPHAVPLSDS